MTNCHKQEWLKTIEIYCLKSEVSVGHKSEGLWLSLLLRAQGQNQGIFLAGQARGRIHFQAHSGCWSKSVSGGCRTEVIPLLAVSWGWSPLLELPTFLLMLSLRAPSSNSKRSPSHDWNVSFHPSALTLWTPRWSQVLCFEGLLPVPVPDCTHPRNAE